MRKNQLIIPRAYIQLFGGNYTHAAVLAEIENIACTYPKSDLFPLSHDDLANWLYLTNDQVRYSLKAIKNKLGLAIQTKVMKFNGTPTTHYCVDLASLRSIKERA